MIRHLLNSLIDRCKRNSRFPRVRASRLQIPQVAIVFPCAQRDIRYKWLLSLVSATAHLALGLKDHRVVQPRECDRQTRRAIRGAEVVLATCSGVPSTGCECTERPTRTAFTQQSGDPHAACIELGKALKVEFGQLVKADHKNCLYPFTVVRGCRSNPPIVRHACEDARADKERDNEKTLNYGQGAGDASSRFTIKPMATALNTTMMVAATMRKPSLMEANCQRDRLIPKIGSAKPATLSVTSQIGHESDQFRRRRLQNYLA